MLKADQYHVSAEYLAQFFEQCACRERNNRLEKPLLAAYLPPFSGHTSCSDISYPIESLLGKKGKPHLVAPCALRIFVVIRQLTRIDPENSARMSSRIEYFGRCRILIADKGRGLIKREIGDFFANWDNLNVTGPKDVARADGLVGSDLA